MPIKKQRVFIWILVICSMVLTMVIIGGVTRLTGSGLSMVEWKPLMGAIPPLSHSEWMLVFGKYQASPQYQLVNRGMSLGDFQWIFFWEYFHRLMGRLLGVFFFIPWVYFWLKGHLHRKRALQLLFGFMLGGLQGFLGWIMVASGLINQPQVSHYRLAAHLLLAFFILAYFWKMAWSFREENLLLNQETQALTQDHKIKDKHLLFSQLLPILNFMIALLVLQIFYGALVAGLKAGFMYNTFPDMEGHFFPLGGLSLNPIGINFFENPLTVQWIHRMLGWTLFLGCFGIFFKYRNNVSSNIKRSLLVLVIIVSFQFGLGVVTLILKVRLPIAVLHQLGASLVLLYLLWMRWETKKQIKKSTSAIPNTKNLKFITNK